MFSNAFMPTSLLKMSWYKCMQAYQGPQGPEGRHGQVGERVT